MSKGNPIFTMRVRAARKKVWKRAAKGKPLGTWLKQLADAASGYIASKVDLESGRKKGRP